MPSRDDFSAKARRTIAERVGFRCSYPGCSVVTIGPNDAVSDRAASVGVAAHIAAASAGGPRYDQAMPSEVRGSPENGIWLCQNHARLIDVDPASHSTETLREWKRIAEERARKRLVASATRLENCSWELAAAMASLHVDVMRLFVVSFGAATSHANNKRLEELHEFAEEQASALDRQISTSGNEVTEDVRSKALAFRVNLGRSLFALKHRSNEKRTARLLYDNLRDTAERVALMLKGADPQLYGEIESAVDAAIPGSERQQDGFNWVDVIAHRRLRAQSAYLEKESPLSSIADDFNQKLAVPYLLIDVRILEETGRSETR